jgi:acyl dehydratase
MAGSPQPVRIDAGIGEADIGAIAGLGATLTGRERSGVQCPLIAALLLFSKLDFPERASLFAPRPGRVLVQEYLSIASFGPLAGDQPILVFSAFHPSPDENGIATIQARLSNTAQEPLVDLKAVLRIAPVATFVEPGPVLPRAATGSGLLRLQTRAFEDAHVSRYLALVGDTNLVHSDRAFIASLGLPDAVVPGGLIAALAEPAVEQFFDGAEIASMKIRFTAPVFLGSKIDVCAQVRQVGAEGRPRDVRLFFVNAGSHIAAIGDIALRERKTGSLTTVNSL